MNEPNSPQQIENALIDIGLDVISTDKGVVKFWYKGNVITYYHKKQWASGRGITDGRGWKKLYKQLIQ